MIEEQDEQVDVVVETVMWVEEEGGERYARGEQLIDVQEQDGEVIKVPSGIKVIAIDELIGSDGESGGDFKIYAEPVDPASPLMKQGLGLALYLPRRNVKKWASVGPLADMMKARDEAMKVVDADASSAAVADDDADADANEEGEVSDGKEVTGTEGSTEHGSHLGYTDSQRAGDASSAPGETGGAEPIRDCGAVDPGGLPSGSGG